MVTQVILIETASAVAQSVGRPDIGSLNEVPLCNVSSIPGHGAVVTVPSLVRNTKISALLGKSKENTHYSLYNKDTSATLEKEFAVLPAVLLLSCHVSTQDKALRYDAAKFCRRQSVGT